MKTFFQIIVVVILLVVNGFGITYLYNEMKGPPAAYFSTASEGNVTGHQKENDAVLNLGAHGSERQIGVNKQLPKDLIIGKWNGVTTEKQVGETLEFFEDGTFLYSTLFLDHPTEHVSFTGTFTFSDLDRLKLTYTQNMLHIGTVETTKPWNSIYVFDIRVDDKYLEILSDDSGMQNKTWVRQ
jgi:hypothetical protein